MLYPFPISIVSRELLGIHNHTWNAMQKMRHVHNNKKANKPIKTPKGAEISFIVEGLQEPNRQSSSSTSEQFGITFKTNETVRQFPTATIGGLCIGGILAFIAIMSQVINNVKERQAAKTLKCYMLYHMCNKQVRELMCVKQKIN